MIRGSVRLPGSKVWARKDAWRKAGSCSAPLLDWTSCGQLGDAQPQPPLCLPFLPLHSAASRSCRSLPRVSLPSCVQLAVTSVMRRALARRPRVLFFTRASARPPIGCVGTSPGGRTALRGSSLRGHLVLAERAEPTAWPSAGSCRAPRSQTAEPPLLPGTL